MPWENKSPVFIGCLVIFEGAGELTREFWADFETNSFGVGQSLDSMRVRECGCGPMA